MTYSIYKITNEVNKKVYIGFTCDTQRRWKNHRNSKEDRHLYRAMKKYGKENFTFEVLFESEDRDYTLEVMEPHFIEMYNSIKNGYNYTTGGKDNNTDEKKEQLRKRMIENNPMKRPETAAKVSEKMKGKTFQHSEEAKEKISKSKLGKNNPNYGNPDSAKCLNVIICCENCGKKMNKGNYIRWHGLKCKFKKVCIRT